MCFLDVVGILFETNQEKNKKRERLLCWERIFVKFACVFFPPFLVPATKSSSMTFGKKKRKDLRSSCM